MPTPKNEAADAPYFTPRQSPPAGTALKPNPPTLFTPLKIRDVTFCNRIWVAPMCTYSAQNGHLTDFHLVHLGAFSFRGASLTIVEATSVLPNGRISPEDSGLWADSQIAPIRRIADFVHSQGNKLGIQLAHAGRKASTIAPWLLPTPAPGAIRKTSITATEDVGGWPDNVWGPSAIQWGDGFASPKEMTLRDIEESIKAFGHAAKRAVAAGVDVIEIHAAHGYLLTSFMSPISNRRTDKYGGSFENRIRMLVEVIKATRKVIPDGMPLVVRISATEWMEEHETGGWNVEQSIQLAKLLPGLGVDLLDVSSGGNHAEQKIAPHNRAQVDIAGRIRAALLADGIKDLKIGAVGMITEAEVARETVQGADGKGEGDATMEVEAEHGQIAKADIVLVARQFLREPEWVLKIAHRLGVEVKWPEQYTRGTFPKGTKTGT